MKRIIIIGGGAAGLGAAYKVTRAASEGHDVEFVLVEKDRRGSAPGFYLVVSFIRCRMAS
jgi:cation diffusion facilitator CzcD-associated flavoprotein CzcO